MPPSIPNKPELFCTGCQQWHPRKVIVAARLVHRLTGHQQAQYFCFICAKKRNL